MRRRCVPLWIKVPNKEKAPDSLSGDVNIKQWSSLQGQNQPRVHLVLLLSLNRHKKWVPKNNEINSNVKRREQREVFGAQIKKIAWEKRTLIIKHKCL